MAHTASILDLLEVENLWYAWCPELPILPAGSQVDVSELLLQSAPNDTDGPGSWLFDCRARILSQSGSTTEVQLSDGRTGWVDGPFRLGSEVG